MGVKVILDPVPVHNLSPSFYQKLDMITPNAVEAEHLVDFSVNDTATAKQAAIQLQKQGPETVIITLGQQGVYCAHDDETFLFLLLKLNL